MTRRFGRACAISRISAIFGYRRLHVLLRRDGEAARRRGGEAARRNKRRARLVPSRRRRLALHRARQADAERSSRESFSGRKHDELLERDAVPRSSPSLRLPCEPSAERTGVRDFSQLGHVPSPACAERFGSHALKPSSRAATRAHIEDMRGSKISRD